MLGVIEDWAVVGEKAAGTSDTDTDTSTDPSDEDLRQVLRQCFRKKRGKRPSNTFLSLLPRVTAYQQCLQLVLQYQVYQVRSAGHMWWGCPLTCRTCAGDGGHEL